MLYTSYLGSVLRCYFSNPTHVGLLSIGCMTDKAVPNVCMTEKEKKNSASHIIGMQIKFYELGYLSERIYPYNLSVLQCCHYEQLLFLYIVL